MTRRSKRELERAVDDLDDDVNDMTATEAYAVLIAAASGDEEALEKLGQLPENQLDGLVGPAQSDSRDTDRQG